jgi:hypothetical protein
MKRIIFLLVIFLNYFTSNLIAVESLSPKENWFSDILLVVHYNCASFNTIPFLKDLYSMFPNIVFYGEMPSSELTASAKSFLKAVVLIPTESGFFLSRILADVKERYPNYKGYIFMQNDVMMNVWNFSRLDKKKIWFAPNCLVSPNAIPASWDMNFDRTKTYLEFVRPESEYCAWFYKPFGLPALEKILPLLSQNHLHMLSSNLGKNIAIARVCDMFYIPQKLMNDASFLGKLFENVFSEISIPFILCCLDHFQNWEFLKSVRFTEESPASYSQCPVIADWIYPMNYSQYHFQNLATQLMREHYK